MQDPDPANFDLSAMSIQNEFITFVILNYSALFVWLFFVNNYRIPKKVLTVSNLLLVPEWPITEDDLNKKKDTDIEPKFLEKKPSTMFFESDESSINLKSENRK